MPMPCWNLPVSWRMPFLVLPELLPIIVSIRRFYHNKPKLFNLAILGTKYLLKKNPGQLVNIRLSLLSANFT